MYKKSKTVLHRYKVIVMGPKGHYDVKNSTFEGFDKRECRELAIDRAKEILCNREFNKIQDSPSFDILIDYIMTECYSSEYSWKQGDI